MRFGETRIHVDPGPGALVRALSHVPPCNPRELDAIVLSHKHLDHSGDLWGWAWGLLGGPGRGLVGPELWLPRGTRS